jgi:hypothetical protein
MDTRAIAGFCGTLAGKTDSGMTDQPEGLKTLLNCRVLL